MNLFETFEGIKIPHWFVIGTHFSALQWDRVTDFIDHGEFNYDWRLCEVPLSEIRENLLVHDQNESTKRKTEINSWLNSSPDVISALAEIPPILLISSLGIEIIDGNHRISVAKERKISSLKMVVGLHDSSRDHHETPLDAAHAFLEDVDPNDVGHQRFGDIILYYEGFSEECWDAYYERIKDGSLANLDAYGEEMVADWEKRAGTPVSIIETGWTRGGEENEPNVFFAIFQATAAIGASG